MCFPFPRHEGHSCHTTRQTPAYRGLQVMADSSTSTAPAVDAMAAASLWGPEFSHMLVPTCSWVGSQAYTVAQRWGHTTVFGLGRVGQI